MDSTRLMKNDGQNFLYPHFDNLLNLYDFKYQLKMNYINLKNVICTKRKYNFSMQESIWNDKLFGIRTKQNNSKQ